MLNIGDMVTLGYAKKGAKPLGIVIGYEDAYNLVKWINGDEHPYAEGGYLTSNLVVLSKAGNHDQI
jgi:hypothetical protein